MLRPRLSRSNAAISAISLLAVSVLALCSLQLVAQDSPSPQPTVREALGFAVSPPLRDLAKLPRTPQYGFHEAPPVRPIPTRDFGVAADPVEQNTVIGAPSVDYSIGFDFLGVGNGFPGYTVSTVPPDTNMAVGDTQIVQSVNTSFAVFNKYNPSDYVGPIDGSLLFGGLGGACAAPNSSIIVQWDNVAHRWLLAQNTLLGPPYYACVAVSTTADATGPYYLYRFPLAIGLSNPVPNDPRWGRWTDTWTQTTNNFDSILGTFVGPGVCVYERSRLLAGSPSPRQVCFQLSGLACSFGGTCQSSLLPADIDSPTNPPAGECQFLIGSVADVTNHNLSLYSVCIDWLHPSQAYITGDNNSELTTVPTYTLPCSDPYAPCVPQKGTTNQLYSVDDRLMYRFAYYNDTHGEQHWYVNHSVKASSNQIGVRWYEFQAPQIAITPPALMSGPFQSGTYAPDSNYRWMGSIAGDMNNDILVGYSVSSSSVYPSIDVAGRLKTNPAGTLEPEVSVIAGNGSQSGFGSNPAWGNFSAMRLDPDDCTFWYTQEFYQVTDPINWSTQIASLKFAGCHNPAYDGYIELCKQTDPDYPVSGTFDFTLTAPFFSGGPYAVPVGSCSPPIEVPSGVVTINEAPQVGVAVENVTAYSDGPFGQIDELDSWTFPQQTATVTVMPGGVDLETVATFTNYAAPPGTLKICKIAGSPSLVGMPFTFTASDGTSLHRDTVNAGPPPGGNCVIDGSWPVNDPVTVTETPVPSGVSVSNITVEPPDRGGPPDLQHGRIVATIGSGFTEVDFTDSSQAPPPQACSGQSLITIDPVHNVGYVPIYQKDAGGNAEIEVVDLAIGSPMPLLKTVTLMGASRPIASIYNPATNTVLVEAAQGSTNPYPIAVYEISTTSPYPVLDIVSTPGITASAAFGAMVLDTTRNLAFVAGYRTVGILHTATSPPVWDTSSVVSTIVAQAGRQPPFNGLTDSMALNLNTTGGPGFGSLFISSDGSAGGNDLIDTTLNPLQPAAFGPDSPYRYGDGGSTDGVAFDPTTNIMLMTTEGGCRESPGCSPSKDKSTAFNFNTLTYNMDGYYQTDYLNAPNNVGSTTPWGEGPGGQAAINCTKHQGVIVDEFGHNLKLIYLPPNPVPSGTPLDNNGDPCGTTMRDSGSVYTIAATTIPQGGGKVLGAVGDPATLTLDPVNNLAYMLGDDVTCQHVWGQAAGSYDLSCPNHNPPSVLYLIRVELTNPAPVPGAGPTGGCNGAGTWNPASEVIEMPN